MPHLIGSIRKTDVTDCYGRLRLAHEFLVTSAQSAAVELAAIEDAQNWGTKAKRVLVHLALERPEVLGKDVTTHNLVEVINQTATIERLLDVLLWTQTPESGLRQFRRVLVCHPCTSSASSSASWENDLVLADSDGQEARFEISDVVSKEDGNQKHRKDLIRLHVIDNNSALCAPPSARCFVAVSEEFAAYVRSCQPSWKSIGCTYAEIKKNGTTRIFEILRAVATTA